MAPTLLQSSNISIGFLKKQNLPKDTSTYYFILFAWHLQNGRFERNKFNNPHKPIFKSLGHFLFNFLHMQNYKAGMSIAGLIFYLHISTDHSFILLRGTIANQASYIHIKWHLISDLALPTGIGFCIKLRIWKSSLST